MNATALYTSQSSSFSHVRPRQYKKKKKFSKSQSLASGGRVLFQRSISNGNRRFFFNFKTP